MDRTPGDVAFGTQGLLNARGDVVGLSQGEGLVDHDVHPDDDEGAVVVSGEGAHAVDAGDALGEGAQGTQPGGRRLPSTIVSAELLQRGAKASSGFVVYSW